MKRTTGLYSLGLLLATVALTMSCSGDEGSSSSTSTGGSSTGGSSAGNSSAGTTNNTAGTTNNTAGTNNNTSGSNNGGTNNPPQGGDGPGPDPQGGDGPGPQGGAGPGNIDECAGDVEDGAECNNDDPCTQAGGGACFCGNNDEWNCIDFGGGGAGPGGNTADCGNAPMNGEDCDGFGQCEGSDTCACFQGNTICQQ